MTKLKGKENNSTRLNSQPPDVDDIIRALIGQPSKQNSSFNLKSHTAPQQMAQDLEVTSSIAYTFIPNKAVETFMSQQEHLFRRFPLR